MLFASVALFGADYDVLIRNGRVVDGTGNPWFRADVGVKDGHIAAIGWLAEKTAEKVIDAGGRIVSPGFIDVHTHIEGDVEKVPRADNYVRDGVTTVILRQQTQPRGFPYGPRGSFAEGTFGRIRAGARDDVARDASP